MAVSPLTQKLGLNKNDQKLIVQGHEAQADGGVGVEELKELEDEKKYTAYLRKTQELALEYPNPPPAMKQQIEERAAEIKALDSRAATRQAKSTADLTKSALTHEEKFQQTMKGLKERRAKAEEAKRMHSLNKKNRL